ncbi:hypothetical protein ACFSJ3_08760 [Corallincola platygyrae]|uniref:Uncharacterized protein n=1 Tax=Corallincola platygyrae TaxID=1193278 RepID=A0ABW4XP19_9GAMM
MTPVRQWLLTVIGCVSYLFAQTTLAEESQQETAAEVMRVKFIPKQSPTDAIHDYLIKVLQLALDKTTPEYGPAEIELLPLPYNQGLLMSLLNHDDIIDVVASAPSKERETAARSARVPITMGLLGYRMMIIRQTDLAAFQQIESPDDLKLFRACQGAHWPDSDILEANGYPVQRINNFDDMFKRLREGSCDYFPRAITEGYSEIEAYLARTKDNSIVAYDDILLRYRLPFLFYTSHENFELAARIEKGMKRAVRSGELKALMKTHPVTKGVFPLSKWKVREIFELHNPDLPKALPLEEPEYWLTLEDID